MYQCIAISSLPNCCPSLYLKQPLFARNTVVAKCIYAGLHGTRSAERGTPLVAVYFCNFLHCLKGKNKHIQMLAITNQNVTLEEKSSSHKISHFVLIGKFQQEEWEMSNSMSQAKTFLVTSSRTSRHAYKTNATVFRPALTQSFQE